MMLPATATNNEARNAQVAAPELPPAGAAVASLASSSFACQFAGLRRNVTARLKVRGPGQGSHRAVDETASGWQRIHRSAAASHRLTKAVAAFHPVRPVPARHLK